MPVDIGRTFVMQRPNEYLNGAFQRDKKDEAKDKLIAFSLKRNVDATSKSSSVGARKRMRVAKDTNLEEAVTKWFVQQRSCGNDVRGVEIQAAAVKLSSHMGIENFEASDGWLWRFRNRHGKCNKITHGEAGSAPTEDIEPFRDRLNDLIKSEGLLISQVYNVDETGLYWRSLPRNTQAFKNEASSPGRKPMDQGIIVACKRIYQRRYLDDVLAFIEEDEDLTEDTRGQRTVNNVKNYNLKSAIFNLAASWKTLKTTTLVNAWKKLLYNVEVEYDFEGFEARDFHHILKRAGENDVTEDDIRNWLEDTEGDPGYQFLTEEEIADEVLVGDSRDSEDEEDEEPLPNKPKLSVIRESTDNVISYIDLSAETDDIQHYYQHIRAVRELIIQRQHHQDKQLKLDILQCPDPEIRKRFIKIFAKTIVKVLLAYADIGKKEFTNYVGDEKKLEGSIAVRNGQQTGSSEGHEPGAAVTTQRSRGRRRISVLDGLAGGLPHSLRPVL
ncbi:tigger transposable element-derived protein 7-like [Homarus americanus]|uniref:tigger transposable element-derived protein 7-like n=1 Tax=Homarus americanus TaxID=6706 RepID=UPI001C457F7E|nr:tigger transposable element-derived protein 7-like [Homarus americanus]